MNTMAKILTRKNKMSTLCKDCTEEPQNCGKDPLECKDESQTYFNLYEETFTKIRRGSK